MVQSPDEGAELRQDRQGRARSTVTRNVREKSTVVHLRDEVDPRLHYRRWPMVRLDCTVARNRPASVPAGSSKRTRIVGPPSSARTRPASPFLADAEW